MVDGRSGAFDVGIVAEISVLVGGLVPVFAFGMVVPIFARHCFKEGGWRMAVVFGE